MENRINQEIAAYTTYKHDIIYVSFKNNTILYFLSRYMFSEHFKKNSVLFLNF